MKYKESYQRLLEKVLKLAEAYYKDRLISFVLFGSVARDSFRPDSDIDILIVAEPLPQGRIRRVEEFVNNVERQLEDDLRELEGQGIYPFLSPIFKTPEEVKRGSPLFLDMIYDAKILFDKGGFFRRYLEGLRERLKALGAKRVFRGGGWYWILKPDYRFGERIEL